jgi:hypothetical protein
VNHDVHGCTPTVDGRWFPWPVGLHSSGFPGYLLREIEIGERASHFEDQEWNTGWSALDDLSYLQYVCQGSGRG